MILIMAVLKSPAEAHPSFGSSIGRARYHGYDVACTLSTPRTNTSDPIMNKIGLLEPPRQSKSVRTAVTPDRRLASSLLGPRGGPEWLLPACRESLATRSALYTRQHCAPSPGSNDRARKDFLTRCELGECCCRKSVSHNLHFGPFGTPLDRGWRSRWSD